MKNEISNFNKENIIDKISLIFIFIFPIILLTGSSIVNTSIVLMNILFLVHIYKEKNLKFLKMMFFIFYLLYGLFL